MRGCEEWRRGGGTDIPMLIMMFAYCQLDVGGCDVCMGDGDSRTCAARCSIASLISCANCLGE